MSIRCDHTVEDVMFLLRRNWFLHSQDVYALFEELSEDVYSEVYYRLHELPIEVHAYFRDRPMHPSKLKVKVRNYDEREWDQEQLAIYESRIKYIRDFKKTYIAPPRPREPMDALLDSIGADLETKQFILEDMQRSTKKSKKYLPPGMRQDDDEPMVREMKTKIKTLENEFESTKAKIVILDKLWSDSTVLDAILANAASSSEATH